MKRKILISALFILVIIPYLASTYVYFLKDPVVWSDEATFLATAIDIGKHGKVATDVFGEQLPSLKDRILWYPPIYFYLLAGWIKIAGYSIEAVRTLSILIGISSLFLFYLLMKNLTGRYKWAAIGVLLLSLSRFFGMDSRTGRMEILVLFFNLGSMILIVIWRKTGRKRFLLGGSIAASLSFLTHPIGIIAFAREVLTIIITRTRGRKKIIDLVLSVTVFGSLCLLGLYRLLLNSRVFLEQYQYQLAKKAASPFFLFNLFQDDYRFRIIYVFYFLVLVTLSFIYFKTKRKNYLYFIVWTLVTYIIIVFSKEIWYPVYLEPMLVGSLVLTMKYLKGKIRNRKIGFLAVSGIAFLIIFWNMVIIYQDNSQIFNFNYHAYSEEISLFLPQKEKTIFLAAIPDPYFDLRQKGKYRLIEYLNLDVSDKAYENTLDEVDYIVVSMDMRQPLVKYIERNAKKIISLNNHSFFSTNIIILKPRDKRT